MQFNSFHPPATVADAEAAISRGLLKLRTLYLTDPDASYAVSMLVPAGYRPVVQLEEDGRKKRNTAAIGNWTPKSGDMFLYFEEGVDEPEISAASGVSVEPQKTDAGAMQAVPSSQANLNECCKALAEAEKQGRPFIALKWFRDAALPQQTFGWAQSPQDRFRVLNEAIAQGLIETQSLANPKNPSHPTTTVRLNREKTRGIVGSRFNPVPLRGEPLSATILRDRG